MDIGEIIDKKQIAIVYMKTWFIIDIISIFPIDILLSTTADDSGTGTNTNVLVRFTKIGKLYKLIRILRLAKVLKILKSKRSMINHFNSELKISSGLERILFFGVFFGFFFHISACMFIYLREVEVERGAWYQDGYHTMANIDLYITACYFIMTTISTVGYGDISASTRLERMFMMSLMAIGVIAFNFLSGALSSVLQNFDTSQAELQQKLLYLNRLKSQYNISDVLYYELKKNVVYDHQTSFAGLDKFVENLPVHLKLEVSQEMYRDNFSKYPLFSKLGGGKHFLAWLGSRMRPHLVTESNFFYQQGDAIDNFYFGLKGLGAFVIPDRQLQMFAVIDPEKSNQLNHSKMRVL